MTMTKKDYQTVAEILGLVKMSQECLGRDVNSLRGAIDDLLQQQNPEYDGNRFWQAVSEQYSEYWNSYIEYLESTWKHQPISPPF